MFHVRAGPSTRENRHGQKLCPRNWHGQKLCPINRHGQKLCPRNRHGQKLWPRNRHGQKLCPRKRMSLRASCSLIVLFLKVIARLVAVVLLLHPFSFSFFTAFTTLSFLLVLCNYLLHTCFLYSFGVHILSSLPPYLHLSYYCFPTLFSPWNSSSAIPLLCFSTSFYIFSI
jgi:hypothetical protein